MAFSFVHGFALENRIADNGRHIVELDNILAIGPFTDTPLVAHHLAANMLAARTARGFSQARLAQLSGIPRSTISNMESGTGNPSLATLSRIASALQIGLDELISPPRRDVTCIRADDIPVEQRSGGQLQISKLLPDRIRGVEIDRMEFAPRTSMRGQPHLVGTKEYLHVLEGSLQVLIAGHYYEVNAGDVLAFAGDQAHSYRNGSSGNVRAISVVIPHVG